jgi:hypothetical protein
VGAVSNKITPIDGGQTPDEMAETLRHIKKNMGQILEFQAVMAELRYNCYKQSIKAGFSPEQSLELAKKPL